MIERLLFVIIRNPCPLRVRSPYLVPLEFPSNLRIRSCCLFKSSFWLFLVNCVFGFYRGVSLVLQTFG
jgi:hypothetical protein